MNLDTNPELGPLTRAEMDVLRSDPNGICDGLDQYGHQELVQRLILTVDYLEDMTPKESL